MGDKPEKYNTLDIARIFDVSPATVRQWVNRGSIKPLPEREKAGHGSPMHMFSKEELSRFANERYGSE